MKKSEGHRWSRRGSIVAAAVAAVAGVTVLSALVTPTCEDRGCPSLTELDRYRALEAVRVYDGEDVLVGQLSGARRFVVPLSSVPDVLREGYVAVEDRRFRSHGGVDLRSVLRAARTNLRVGRIEEGASTITMQLVRNAFGPELLEWNSFRRKLAEVVLALEVEKRVDKDRILELYLNQIYLGDGVYGVETAARHYFGKSVSDVTDREAALLIGLAKNPEGYDPRTHPRAAGTRIQTVLGVLRREGVLSRERAIAARWEGLSLAVREAPAAATPTGWGDDAYYLAAVRRELREMVPDPAERSGLRVFTGLDRPAQAAAVRSLTAQIERIEAGRFGPFDHDVPGDSLSSDPRGGSPWLQGMVVAMEPHTGLVTTLVGGRDYQQTEFDRAFQARRQPGSAFKPIVYAEALESGARLHHTLSTDPVRLVAAGSDPWEPTDHVDGRALTLRDALVHSSNTITVRVGMELGPARVAERARSLGIQTDLPLYPSLYLGAGEVVPAELVAAYAAFGNGGRAVRPHLIRRIEDPSGAVLFQREPDAEGTVLDPRTAYLMLDALRDVVRRGTGWRAAASGTLPHVAGKTGTTDGSKDVWFIGLTPGRVAGVWLGFDRPRTIVPDAEGGALAAPVWASFMAVADRDRPADLDWPAPEGVVSVRFDPRTGFHLPGDCPAPGTVRTEWALETAAPPLYCPYEVRRPGSRWFRGAGGSIPRTGAGLGG